MSTLQVTLPAYLDLDSAPDTVEANISPALTVGMTYDVQLESFTFVTTRNYDRPAKLHSVDTVDELNLSVVVVTASDQPIVYHTIANKPRLANIDATLQSLNEGFVQIHKLMEEGARTYEEGRRLYSKPLEQIDRLANSIKSRSVQLANELEATRESIQLTTREYISNLINLLTAPKLKYLSEFEDYYTTLTEQLGEITNSYPQLQWARQSIASILVTVKDAIDKFNAVHEDYRNESPFDRDRLGNPPYLKYDRTSQRLAIYIDTNSKYVVNESGTYTTKLGDVLIVADESSAARLSGFEFVDQVGVTIPSMTTVKRLHITSPPDHQGDYIVQWSSKLPFEHWYTDRFLLVRLGTPLETVEFYTVLTPEHLLDPKLPLDFTTTMKPQIHQVSPYDDSGSVSSVQVSVGYSDAPGGVITPIEPQDGYILRIRFAATILR